MDYLSNVRICIAKRDVRKIKKVLNKVKSNLWDICNLKIEFTGADGLLYVIFGWQNIEWYLYYTDIFLLVKTLKEFKYKGIPYKFVRIGQRSGDIEQDYCYDRNNVINSSVFLTYNFA